MPDDFDAAELAGSAKINFENLARMVPAVAAHPMFQIAKMQLDELVVRLQGAPLNITAPYGEKADGTPRELHECD